MGEDVHRFTSDFKTHSALSFLLLFFLLLTGTAGAEIDPIPRTNFELGFEDAARGNSPLGGYGFFLWNQPHFKHEDLYLFTVVSPYLYAEAIRDKWPGPGQAVGASVGGGFLVNNFDSFADGRFVRQDSFRGDGADGALSYYLRPPSIGGILPVEGILRAGSRYAFYKKSGDTAHDYVLPENTFIHSGRVGVRVGGVPPELLPSEALEFSLWHQADYRRNAGPYGRPGFQRETGHLTQQTWGRLGGIFPFRGHRAGIMMSAGLSGRTNELSCYRMGSGLRFQDEFPYLLHGYYFREIFARKFFLLNTSYRFPLMPAREWLQLQLNYDFARVKYEPGHELPRDSLNGFGADLILKMDRDITLSLGYGYGLDAPRDGSFGGHEINMMLEWKL